MLISNQWYKWRLAWRRGLARSVGVKLGRNVRLARSVDFNLGAAFAQSPRPSRGGGIIKLGDSVWIEQGTVIWAFDGEVDLRTGVFIGPHVTIYGHGGVTIGINTLISSQCTILSSNHHIPATGQNIRDQPDELLPTKIGDQCWIGAGCQILGGTTLGDGCVIGAGAVVTKDIPAGAVALGNPARVVRMR